LWKHLFNSTDEDTRTYHDFIDFISKEKEKSFEEGYSSQWKDNYVKAYNDEIRTQTLTEVIGGVEKIRPQVYYRRIINKVEVDDVAVPLSDIKTMVEEMK